jgi:CheY-like chemotaxis protein
MERYLKKLIMVVEDDQAIRDNLRELLETEGYDVVTAGNGAEALDLLDTPAAKPGLILLDLMMPGMDGYEFRSEQEKNPAISDIPVLVMTADGHIEEKSSRVKAKSFVRKPISIDRLLELISEHGKFGE